RGARTTGRRMTTHHPDLPAEQAYLDHAHRCLERARQDAFRMRALTEVGRGGTPPGPPHGGVLEAATVSRPPPVHPNHAARGFGRIDRVAPGPDGPPGA